MWLPLLTSADNLILITMESLQPLWWELVKILSLQIKKLKKITLNLFLIFSGLNIGDSSGAFNPAVTSNFALQNGQANAQFGGGANIGSLDLGNGGTDFENLLDFSQIGNLLQGR